MYYDINFDKCTTLAYEDLMILPQVSFPLFPSSCMFRDSDLKIISFEKYAFYSGLSERELTDNYDLTDGYAIKELRPGLKLILYDDKKYDPRSEHTIWHEVGHFRLEHQKHGSAEEIETNFYASQTRMPNAILREIKSRGYLIDEWLLMDLFDVSKESALKKMDYLGRCPFIHRNQYDDAVILKFRPWLNRVAPTIAEIEYNDYDDTMDTERLGWLYGG